MGERGRAGSQGGRTPSVVVASLVVEVLCQALREQHPDGYKTLLHELAQEEGQPAWPEAKP
ncbi:hypothetical protein [Streptomyces bobili]|uniref:hypothetical protein n=1 Tax=Streptomyces bobili TaxID=67280 RepID=UPI003713600A